MSGTLTDMSAGRQPSGLARLVELIDTWCSERQMNLSEFSRRAGINRQTLYNLRDGRNSNLRSGTKDGIERLLDWAPGSVDAILAGGDPTLQHRGEPARPESTLRTVAADVELTFEEALEVYGKALQQLRRVATIDRTVSPETLAIVEDWDTMFTGLRYGGVTVVYRMLAERYQQLLADPKSSDQAG